MPVKQLPQCVVLRLSSMQVISSVSSVVKELMENSIDAGADTIDIQLEKNGLDKIEIRDNGSGIYASDVPKVCLPSHTSKISDFSDLERLESYGFRGEALNSLCSVSKLCIITRTEEDEYATHYIFNKDGSVAESKPSHQMKGTIVLARDLFKNIPVRRQYFENGRKGAEYLRQVEHVVKMLAVVHLSLRVTLTHNRCLIWQKTCVPSLKQCLFQIYPNCVVKHLELVEREFKGMSLEMIIVKSDCNIDTALTQYNTHNAVLLYVNKRPISDKKIERLVAEEISNYFTSKIPRNKCPITLISLKLPPDTLDVNLEPDKTKLYMKDRDRVLSQIRESVIDHLYQKPPGQEWEEVGEDLLQVLAKKRKTEQHLNELNFGPEDFEEESICEKDVYGKDATGGKVPAVVDEVVLNDVDAFVAEELAKAQEVGGKVRQGKDLKATKMCRMNHLETDKRMGTETKESEGNITGFFDIFQKDEKIGLEEWSRGDMTLNGRKLSNSTVVVPSLKQMKLDNILNISKSLDESMDEVREMDISNGISNFAKEMREEDEKNKSGVPFCRVASQLASRWRKIQSPSEKPGHTMNGSCEKKLFQRKTYRVDFTSGGIRDNIFKKRTSSNFIKEAAPRLVGKIGRDIWIYSLHHEIGATGGGRLREAVLYEELMRGSIHVLKWSSPSPLSKGCLEPDMLALLSDLKMIKFEDTYIVDDSRISSNGFKITFGKKGEGGMECWVQMCEQPLFMDLNDLREVLHRIIEGKANVFDCRPTKIQNFFKKRVENSLAAFEDDESAVKGALSSYVQFGEKASECIHGKPVAVKLRSL